MSRSVRDPFHSGDQGRPGYRFGVGTYRARAAGSQPPPPLVELDVDLGFGIVLRARVKLYGVSGRFADEVRARRCAEFVEAWLDEADAAPWPLRLYTIDRDIFGRFSAQVFRGGDDKGDPSLNEDLMRFGHADADL